MSCSFSLLVLTTTVLASFLFISQCSSSGGNKADSSQTAIQQDKEVPELADYMATMQYYTHKFALAVDAGNKELAQFYFNEIRALSDVIKEDVPGYEGYNIAQFIGLFLEPTFQPVNDALAGNDWKETRVQVEQMIDSCNSCHNATSHGFVQVTPGFEKNPYNQNFSERR